MNKSHLFFRNPTEGVVAYKPKLRPVTVEHEVDEEAEKNYSPMKNEFKSSLSIYFEEKKKRDSQRNSTLNIPLTIDFIQIEFFSHFKIDPFENRYKINFGLTPIRYDYFNSLVLFAIEDSAKFQEFIDNINIFIASENDSAVPSNLNRDILYISRFKYFTTLDRLKHSEQRNRYIIELVDSIDIYESKIQPIEDSLLKYLKDSGVPYTIDYKTNKLELLDIAIEKLKEVANNFDIVMTVNSPITGIVKPTLFNLESKEYGFEISNLNSELPIVGIIDTGVSSQTPLAPLIVNDGSEFDLTNTDPRIDNSNHGTAVAAIAALGKNFIIYNSGKIESDAKILSIKVLDGSNGFISENSIISLITEANKKYGIKIFVLCLGYFDPKLDNSSISNYAYSLDLLTYELDILIFISVGNAPHLCYDARGNLIDYPFQFDNPLYNISVPADSMNNLSCGAISSNLEDTVNNCYNIFDPLYPAGYSRKYFINRKNIKSSLISKHLVKPDICDCGGDIDLNTEFIATGLRVLSATPGVFFERALGTSYSTPIIANQALKLLRLYPQLNDNIQTIKAIILNSGKIPDTGNLFDSLSNVSAGDLFGKGISETENSLFSDENKVTLILEDSIKPGMIKSYPIKLPAYLLGLDKKISLLEINATLCYKFKPVLYNHLAYCPVHIAFGIFKDIDLELIEMNEKGKDVRKGINGGSSSDIVFKESWSEDYYFKTKMLSNCQKIRFVISKQDLINEDCQFKIAVRSKLHGYLNVSDKDSNDIQHPYSLVITIKENPTKGVLSNKLYDEIILINELEVINEIETEIELEN